MRNPTVSLRRATTRGGVDGGGEKEPSFSAGGNVDLCKQKKETELPYDPEVPLLGMFPKDPIAQSREDICTPMFTAALFTMVQIWKLPHTQELMTE